MVFHENRLLGDDYHEISYLICFRKLGKMTQNVSSAAVVDGASRVNDTVDYCPSNHDLSSCFRSDKAPDIKTTSCRRRSDRVGHNRSLHCRLVCFHHTVL